MRLAVIRCADAGVPACVTVHDALAFCVPEESADEQLKLAAEIMEKAAADVCGPIGVDIHPVRHGERYEDEGGIEFFNRVWALAGE